MEVAVQIYCVEFFNLKKLYLEIIVDLYAVVRNTRDISYNLYPVFPSDNILNDCRKQYHIQKIDTDTIQTLYQWRSDIFTLGAFITVSEMILGYCRLFLFFSFLNQQWKTTYSIYIFAPEPSECTINLVWTVLFSSFVYSEKAVNTFTLGLFRTFFEEQAWTWWRCTIYIYTL